MLLKLQIKTRLLLKYDLYIYTQVLCIDKKLIRNPVFSIIEEPRNEKTCLSSFRKKPDSTSTESDLGAPIAQLGESRTLVRKVAGSILTWGTML